MLRARQSKEPAPTHLGDLPRQQAVLSTLFRKAALQRHALRRWIAGFWTAARDTRFCLAFSGVSATSHGVNVSYLLQAYLKCAKGTLVKTLAAFSNTHVQLARTSMPGPRSCPAPARSLGSPIGPTWAPGRRRAPGP